MYCYNDKIQIDEQTQIKDFSSLINDIHLLRLKAKKNANNSEPWEALGKAYSKFYLLCVDNINFFKEKLSRESNKKNHYLWIWYVNLNLAALRQFDAARADLGKDYIVPCAKKLEGLAKKDKIYESCLAFFDKNAIDNNIDLFAKITKNACEELIRITDRKNPLPFVYLHVIYDITAKKDNANDLDYIKVNCINTLELLSNYHQVIECYREYYGEADRFYESDIITLSKWLVENYYSAKNIPEVVKYGNKAKEICDKNPHRFGLNLTGSFRAKLIIAKLKDSSYHNELKDFQLEQRAIKNEIDFELKKNLQDAISIAKKSIKPQHKIKNSISNLRSKINDQQRTIFSKIIPLLECLPRWQEFLIKAPEELIQKLAQKKEKLTRIKIIIIEVRDKFLSGDDVIKKTGDPSILNAQNKSEVSSLSETTINVFHSIEENLKSMNEQLEKTENATLKDSEISEKFVLMQLEKKEKQSNMMLTALDKVTKDFGEIKKIINKQKKDLEKQRKKLKKKESLNEKFDPKKSFELEKKSEPTEIKNEDKKISVAPEENTEKNLAPKLTRKEKRKIQKENKKKQKLALQKQDQQKDSNQSEKLPTKKEQGSKKRKKRQLKNAEKQKLLKIKKQEQKKREEEVNAQKELNKKNTESLYSALEYANTFIACIASEISNYKFYVCGKYVHNALLQKYTAYFPTPPTDLDFKFILDSKKDREKLEEILEKKLKFIKTKSKLCVYRALKDVSNSPYNIDITIITKDDSGQFSFQIETLKIEYEKAEWKACLPQNAIKIDKEGKWIKYLPTKIDCFQPVFDSPKNLSKSKINPTYKDLFSKNPNEISRGIKFNVMNHLLMPDDLVSALLTADLGEWLKTLVFLEFKSSFLERLSPCLNILLTTASEKPQAKAIFLHLIKNFFPNFFQLMDEKDEDEELMTTILNQLIHLTSSAPNCNLIFAIFLLPELVRSELFKSEFTKLFQVYIHDASCKVSRSENAIGLIKKIMDREIINKLDKYFKGANEYFYNNDNLTNAHLTLRHLQAIYQIYLDSKKEDNINPTPGFQIKSCKKYMFLNDRNSSQKQFSKGEKSPLIIHNNKI